MLTGYKTYIVAAIAVLSALAGYFDQQLTLLQALEAVGLAVGLAGNRAIIKVGEVLNAPFKTAAGTGDPVTRQWVTYIGSAVTALSAVLSGMASEQPPAVTIAAILGALGLSFLGLGASKIVAP